jgi:hypothetical protein
MDQSAESASAAARVEWPNGVSDPASASPMTSEHAQLRRRHDVSRQVVECQPGNPGRQLHGQRLIDRGQRVNSPWA